jgi:hypothetical protein
MSNLENRQIVLASRPTGAPTLNNFRTETQSVSPKARFLPKARCFCSRTKSGLAPSCNLHVPTHGKLKSPGTSPSGGYGVAPFRQLHRHRLLRRGDTRIQLPGVAGLRGRGSPARRYRFSRRPAHAGTGRGAVSPSGFARNYRRTPRPSSASTTASRSPSPTSTGYRLP